MGHTSIWTVTAFFLVFLFPGPVAADDLARKIDMTQMKKDSELFEDIVNTSIRQVVSNPMLLAEKTRGSYLENYGVVFSLTLNLSRSLIIFPIARKPKAPGTAEKNTAQTIEMLRKSLSEILGQYGNSLKQLSSDSRISIIAHVLNQSEYGGAGADQVLVLTVFKRDVEQLQRARITLDDFKKRIRYLEY